MKRLFPLFLALSLGLAACGDDDNPEPSIDAASRPDAPGADVDAGPVDAAVDASPDPDANCDGPNGCFSCAPDTTTEHLNHCTDRQCTPFDNVARLPLYNNGDLPPPP